MKLRTWATFVASAVVGGALVLPLNAGAFQRRVDATACFAGGGPFQAQGGDWNIKNNNPNAILNLMCPLPDDDSLLPQNINFLNIHGKAASSVGGITASAQPCLHFWDTFGGTCGTSVSTNVQNSQFALSMGHPSIFSSANFNHFKYINVILPFSAGLAGIFISN